MSWTWSRSSMAWRPSVVGFPDDDARPDASAGHPHGESVRIMVAAVAFFRHGRAAKLTAPDDQRLVQQAPALEVFDQAGDRLIHRAAGFGVVAFDVGVRSPTCSPRRSRSERTARRARPAGGPASRVGRWSRRPDRPGRKARAFRLSRATGRLPRVPRLACGTPARSS